MEILQIGKYYHPCFGGVESHLYALIDELKDTVNFKVLVSNTKFKTDIEHDDGVMIFRLASLGRLFSLPLTFSLPYWLRKLDGDIIHFHLPNPLAVIAFFLARPSGKVVVAYHSDIIRQNVFSLFFKPLLILFLRKAEAIIVSSKNLIDNSRALKRFKDKCRVVADGIDIERFSLTPQVMKQAEEIRQKFSSPIVLFVGRLVYYKGLGYLLEAMKKIKAHLIIVGDGPLRMRLERQAVRLGVASKVIFLGRIGDEVLPAYYYACEVFILPSSMRAESFGRVQLEAFACKKPVVSTNLPTGVPYVNLHKKTGLIIPPADSGSLADAVNYLLKSDELRKSYGENGRLRLEREFTKEVMSGKILKIYSEINPKPCVSG